MDAIVVLALVVAAAVCLMPGIMAWSHYFGGSKKTARSSKAVGLKKTVPAGNA